MNNNYCPVEASINRYLDEQEDMDQYQYTERSRCKCGRFFRRERSGYCERMDGPDRCPACIEAAYQGQREANLQRWGLRPEGTNIEIRGAE